MNSQDLKKNIILNTKMKKDHRKNAVQTNKNGERAKKTPKLVK